MGKATENSSEITQRDISIDYLRAFVIVLVVLLHSALAYTTFSTFNQEDWTKSTAPIVDKNSIIILDPIVSYLDTFFMPLMFLVSGFFIIPGLARYGSGKYIVHRIKRLGVPFIFAVLFIAPIAFLPSFLASSPQSSSQYLLRFFTRDGWPTGPAWFLWVLLAFNCVIALLYRVKPAILTSFKTLKVIIIFFITFIAFFPLRLIASHTWWFSSGPFDFQPIRMGVYFSYIVLGITLSNAGGLQKAGWTRKWPLWLFIGFSAFLAYSFLPGCLTGYSDTVSVLIISISFTASCTGSSFGFLGAFRKLGERRNAFFDSLCANSFVIFITHYAYTIWIQYLLLSIGWSPLMKFIITFIGALLLSWGTSITLRKIPIVRSFI